MNKEQIKILIDIALKSGEIALKHFYDDNLSIIKKTDNSPVTKADNEIDSFIEEKLKKHFPDICVISEEGGNRTIKGNKFWLIDPIDGTKQFISKNNEFTINIALIEDKKPTFGLIYAPMQENSPLYFTNEQGSITKYLVKLKQFSDLKKDVSQINKTASCFTFAIKKHEKQAIEGEAWHDVRIISSKRSSDDEIIELIKNKLPKIDADSMIITKMASSLKFCQIIENRQDIFISQKPTMEWDSAAGHALILAYGGVVRNLYGEELAYDKADFLNKGFVGA